MLRICDLELAVLTLLSSFPVIALYSFSFRIFPGFYIVLFSLEILVYVGFSILFLSVISCCHCCYSAKVQPT